MKGLRFIVYGLWTLVKGLWNRSTRILFSFILSPLLWEGLGVGLLLSCQDELCYNHNHAVPVRLHFTYSPQPEENPKQMNVYFFPSTGDAPLMYQTSGSGVETVLLPIGKYRVMCLNSDTETIEYHNTDGWDDFYVTARHESTNQETRADGEEVLLQPENLFVATIDTDSALMDYEKGYDLHFGTNNVVFTYNFTIEGVKNLQYVSDISGFISGLASGYRVCTSLPYKTPCTHGFDASFDAKKENVYLSMMTFGKLLDDMLFKPVESTLTLFVTLIDGSVWRYDFDVTDQLNTAVPDADLRIYIYIDDIPIPVPVSPGNSSFNPDVDGWGEGEEIPVPM